MGIPERTTIARDVISKTGISAISRTKAKIRCIGDECISKNNNLSTKFEELYVFLESVQSVMKV